MAYPPSALPNDTGNISANKSFELKDFNDRFGNIKAYIESLKEGIDNKVDKIEGSSLVEDDYINALKAFLPICPNVSIYIDTYTGDGEIYFDDFIRKENDREFQFIFYVDKDYNITSVNDLYVQTYNGGYLNLSKQFKVNTGNYISKGYWVRTDGTHFYPARDFFAKFYRDLLTFLPFCEVSVGSDGMSFKTNLLKDSQTFQYLFYIPNSITLNSTFKFMRYDGTNAITADNCFFDDQALSSNIDFSGYWVRIDETHFYTAKTFLSKFKTSIDSKVDKVNGKGLSTNDFTNSYKTSLDNLYSTSNTSKNGHSHSNYLGIFEQTFRVTDFSSLPRAGWDSSEYYFKMTLSHKRPSLDSIWTMYATKSSGGIILSNDHLSVGWTDDTLAYSFKYTQTGQMSLSFNVKYIGII